MPNMFVNSLACVALETLSTESDHKDFIAIGMTINRGEDLAVKGTVKLCPILGQT
jgi:cleavage and polyadenylation specificity factor subunit 1